MGRLFRALFAPGATGPGDGGEESPQDFALLPEESPEEIALSELHSRLDRVFSFLQREVGYTLLEDMEPHNNGGVRILRLSGPPAAPRGSTAVMPRKDLEPPMADEEARQIIRLSPQMMKYAQYTDDIFLVWRFVTLISSSVSAEDEAKVKHEELYKRVMQGVRLMHMCEYNYSDVVLTLAYASVYFGHTFGLIGQKMGHREAAHVCVLMVFLAHCFVLDENCPLRCWQEHIFNNYCTLKTLDKALFRMFEVRSFALRITKEEEKHALSMLVCQQNGVDIVPMNRQSASEEEARASRAVEAAQKTIEAARAAASATAAASAAAAGASSSAFAPFSDGRHVANGHSHPP